MQSRLQRALRRGLQPGGNLADELFRLGDYPIATEEDARAVCEVLERFPLPQAAADDFFKDWTPLHAVTALFQQVESEEAFAVLFEHGIPHLLRLFDEMIAEPGENADALLFILKILVMYQSTEGAVRVVEAAQKPLRPESYVWSVIFEQFEEDEHPYLPWLCKELSDPLPRGFIAVAFLDCANQAAIEGIIDEHPFDTPAGRRRLEAWLTNRDEEEYSYAQSAAASLPFISPPHRDRLLALALDHADTKVQLEAAWASAELGSAAGVKYLGRLCLDPRTSGVACTYLRELGDERAIPDEAMDPDFLAMSDLCSWLAHPNEFGRPPDEIELVDKRELFWPPTDDRRTVWLFRYVYYDDPRDEGWHRGDRQPDDPHHASAGGASPAVVGVGMVGSVTYALTSDVAPNMDPLDVYALHCCWELQINKDDRAPSVRTVRAGRRILEEHNPNADEVSEAEDAE